MRWWACLLLVIVALSFQASIAPRLAVLGARPDFLIVTVVFLALHGRRRDAVLIAWCTGMCADLMSVERVGLLALSYALAAWLVGTVRDYLFRHQPLTQFVVTFFTAALLELGWLFYRRMTYSFGEALPVDVLRSLLLAPLYTALVAPPAHRALLAVAPLLGLPRPRYSFAGTQTARIDRV